MQRAIRLTDYVDVAAAAGDSTRGRARVLVVEDDESIRRLLVETLRVRDYEIFEAADGAGALAVARECRPDAILLDIGLPNVDGFGVLAQLKGDPELGAVPVLMVTAWADADLVRRALDRGAHDYVKKPFTVEELGARVDAACRVKARQDALAADNHRLAAMALADELTGLPNRRALEAALERQAAEAARSGRPFATLLLDLDGFKFVNDTYGHAVGDALLGAVARRLSAVARAADEVGRWGGDELLVVAPDTDVAGAAALGERLRRAVCDGAIDTAAVAIRASVSIGCAVTSGDEAPAALLERCDAALYDAKRAGRDCVRVHGAPALRAVA